MADKPAPRRRIPLWALITGTIVVSLMLVIGALFAWFYSDADLRAEDALTRAAGLPVSWEERGLVMADKPVLDDVARLGILVKTVKTWQSVSGKSWKSGDPIPDGMRSHHAGLPAADVEELLAILDRLPDRPVLHTQVTFASPLSELTSFRAASKFCGERCALADPAARSREIQRLIRTARALPGPDLLITHLIRVSLAAVASNLRLTDIAELRQDPTLPSQLRDLAATLEHQHSASMLGEMLTLRAGCDMPAATIFGGTRLSSVMQAVALRWGRGPALHAERDWHLDLLHATDARAQLHAAKLQDARLMATSRWNPTAYVTKLVMPAATLVTRKTMITCLRLHLLAAELDGSPWPEDDFALPGTPLHRVERDGHLVYAYSVGENGVDDGGKEHLDECFPLYGPVTLPVPKTND